MLQANWRNGECEQEREKKGFKRALISIVTKSSFPPFFPPRSQNRIAKVDFSFVPFTMQIHAAAETFLLTLVNISFAES